MLRSISAVFVSFSLAGCVPPMPPDVAEAPPHAHAEERPFVCRGGDLPAKGQGSKAKNKKRMAWKKFHRKHAKMRKRMTGMKAMHGQGGAKSGADAAPPKGPPNKGSLLVERTDKEAPVLRNAKELFKARVKLRADRARLGDIALGLSDALGVAVVVQTSLTGRRVTMAMPDGSVGQVVRVLREGLGLAISYRARTLHIESYRWVDRRNRMNRKRRRARAERKRRGKLGGKLETLIVPVPAGISPRQLAVTYCRTIASRRGSASVLGEAVMIRDRARHVATFKATMDAVRDSINTGETRHTKSAMGEADSPNHAKAPAPKPPKTAESR